MPLDYPTPYIMPKVRAYLPDNGFGYRFHHLTWAMQIRALYFLNSDAEDFYA